MSWLCSSGIAVALLIVPNAGAATWLLEGSACERAVPPMCIGRFATFEDDELFAQCEERFQKYEEKVRRYSSCLKSKAAAAKANLSEMKTEWQERSCQFRRIDQSQCK